MESLPAIMIGSSTYFAPSYPTRVKRDTYTVTANMRTKTCSLADRTGALPEVSGLGLASPQAVPPAGACST